MHVHGVSFVQLCLLKLSSQTHTLTYYVTTFAVCVVAQMHITAHEVAFCIVVHELHVQSHGHRDMQHVAMQLLVG